jgi:POT family proton-dependent oligopeptide transporter
MGINIGAGIAPVVAAFMRKKFGWSAAFATAGVGMMLSMIIFTVFRRHLEVANERSSVSTVLDVSAWRICKGKHFVTSCIAGRRCTSHTIEYISSKH